MSIITDYCKKQMLKVQADFAEDIRSVQKLRARDRSDYDLIMQKIQEEIDSIVNKLDVNQTYFETFASSISLLTENINMQMESDMSDYNDRKLMSLYGSNNAKPDPMDHQKNSQLIQNHNKFLVRAGGGGNQKGEDPINLEFATKAEQSISKDDNTSDSKS